MTITHTTTASSRKISDLDMEPIKYKLVTEKGWSPEFADKIEEAYKGFLLLNSMRPDFPLVPTQEIDEMWHLHILDTLKYISDCEEIFGGYLHHFPYFGIRNGVDADEIQSASKKTQDYFKEVLGIDVSSSEYKKSAAEATTCGGGVSCRSSYNANAAMVTCGGGVSGGPLTSCKETFDDITTCGGGVSCRSVIPAVLPSSLTQMQVHWRPFL